jgi:hypothetical protein
MTRNIKEMKNISIITLLAITLICNSAYAETTKSSKNIKLTDTNKTMTDEEFLKEFDLLDKETKEVDKQLEAQKKLRKTVDEIKNKLGVK